jgi:hypothetical protein
MSRMKELLGDEGSGYPEFPGHVDDDTSLKAADKVAPRVAFMHGQILDCIRASDDGATCDEIEIALRMKHQTASARIRELVLGGLLRDRGDRRQTRSGATARVYEIMRQR